MDLTSDSMHQLTFAQIELNTVAVRVLFGYCPSQGLSSQTCAQGGPGSERALVNLGFPNGGLPHELGHAFGFAHVNMPVGAKLNRPMMFGRARLPHRTSGRNCLPPSCRRFGA